MEPTITTSDDAANATEQDEVDLFHLSTDEFVNNAALVLVQAAQKVPLQSGQEVSIRIEPDRIVLEDASNEAIEHIRDVLESQFTRGLRHTHQRSAVAYQINRALGELGRGKNHADWVAEPSMPFPYKTSFTYDPFITDSVNSRGMTNYEDDQVTFEALESAEIDPGLVGISEDDDARALYKARSTYTGSTRADQVARLTPEIGEYLDTYIACLRSDEESPIPNNNACASCGSTTMLTGKTTGEAWGDYVRYNQSSNPFTANDGNPTALGQKSADSSHRGRCVACVLAGFHYMFMDKPVCVIDPSEGTTRVFTPLGDFEKLDAIHRLMDERMDCRDVMGNSLSRTVGTTFTESEGFQVLDFFNEMLQEYSKRADTVGWTVTPGERYPTGVRSFVSGTNPNGGRQIDSFHRIDAGSWVYELLKYRPRDSTEDGELWAYESDERGGYWPFDQVLTWYANVDLSSNETLEHRKNQLAYGLLDYDPDEVTWAIAEIYKRTLSDENPQMGRFYSKEAHHYLNYIMNRMLRSQNGGSLDEQTRESIYKVGLTLGRAFSGPEGIGMLTRLQNASTRDSFEDALRMTAEALHKRRLEAMKESKSSGGESADIDETDDGGESDESKSKNFSSMYRSEDIDRLYDAVMSDNYREVQRVLTGHAFLEAQSDLSYRMYKNRQSNEADDEEATPDQEN